MQQQNQTHGVIWLMISLLLSRLESDSIKQEAKPVNMTNLLEQLRQEALCL